jgi:catechol 2,3-dioxygenase-like lactoylglutathione lyase family enzyme
MPLNARTAGGAAVIQFDKAIPILDVRNIETALRFYVEKLGFQVAFQYADNYAGVRRDQVYFEMQWQAEDHFLWRTAGRLRVRVVVNDPDALFEEYKAKGVLRSGAEVRDTEWGTREFAFRDPDGNGLVFYRPLERAFSSVAL